MSRPKGSLSIDPQDIVGQCLGKYEVTSYDGSRYDHTRGGDRLRHYYNCIDSDGDNKVVRRSQVLKGEQHNGY